MHSITFISFQTNLKEGLFCRSFDVQNSKKKKSITEETTTINSIKAFLQTLLNKIVDMTSLAPILDSQCRAESLLLHQVSVTNFAESNMLIDSICT